LAVHFENEYNRRLQRTGEGGGKLAGRYHRCKKKQFCQKKKKRSPQRGERGGVASVIPIAHLQQVTNDHIEKKD